MEWCHSPRARFALSLSLASAFSRWRLVSLRPPRLGGGIAHLKQQHGCHLSPPGVAGQRAPFGGHLNRRIIASNYIPVLPGHVVADPGIRVRQAPRAWLACIARESLRDPQKSTLSDYENVMKIDRLYIHIQDPRFKKKSSQWKS